MTYYEDILVKLEDPDNWPGFNRPDFVNELIELADNSFEKKTVEGYLASVMIYHQITEEFIRVIIESSTFYIQLSVFPQEFRNRELGEKMFGLIIQELKQSVVDHDTYLLIEKSEMLNKLRIQVVHKLTKTDTILKIKNECVKVHSMFNEIWELFEIIYDRYQVTFKDFRKDIEEMKQDT